MGDFEEQSREACRRAPELSLIARDPADDDPPQNAQDTRDESTPGPADQPAGRAASP